MSDLHMLAYTAITADDKKAKAKAKKEMKRRFGYRMAQQAMLRVRQGLVLLAPPRPNAPPKEMTVHQAIDWGSKDATVIAGTKGDEIMFFDEISDVDIEQHRLIWEYYNDRKVMFDGQQAIQTTLLPSS